MSILLYLFPPKHIIEFFNILNINITSKPAPFFWVRVNKFLFRWSLNEFTECFYYWKILVLKGIFILLHYMEEDGKGGRNWQAEWRKCMWSLVIPRDFLLPSLHIFLKHIWINANFSELVSSHARVCLVRFFMFLGFIF